MAQQILDTLLEVHDLPTDSTWMIFVEEYGILQLKDDTAERATLRSLQSSILLSKNGGNAYLLLAQHHDRK